jgi:hypothetical protein
LKLVRQLVVLVALVALAAPCGAAWGQPADQLAFVAANAVVRPPDGTRTPLKGVERKIAVRDKAVCAAKRSPEIRDWVGVVRWNEDDGDVVHLTIAIGDHVAVSNLIRPKGRPPPRGPRVVFRSTRAPKPVRRPVLWPRKPVYSGAPRQAGIFNVFHQDREVLECDSGAGVPEKIVIYQ